LPVQATPFGQGLLQEPQCSGLVLVSAQTPEQQVLGLGQHVLFAPVPQTNALGQQALFIKDVTLSHAVTRQAPPVQATAVACGKLSVEQVLKQAPQFARSSARSLHVPAQQSGISPVQTGPSQSPQ
jgi:hypothetical protein